MDVYLVSSPSILCSAKCDKYESYILAGIECPLHAFSNSIQFRIELPVKYRTILEEFKGPRFVDSIYDTGSVCCSDPCSQENCNSDQSVLCVTENQDVLDYYCRRYEDVVAPCTELDKRSRVSFLMKESVGTQKLKDKRMIGVIFTSRAFESTADSICAQINEHSRAYKVFLKDVSYERLISIDNLDCIVLVDCPLFQRCLSLHIPMVMPFSVEGAFSGEVHTCSSKELAVKSHASEVMELRLFKGAVYRNNEEDMAIHVGRKGIASGYENEGSAQPDVSAH